MEINLEEGFNNPEKAKDIVRQVNAAFNELTVASTTAIKTAKEQRVLAEEYHKQLKDSQQANISLNEAINNIYSLLNSKKDLWDADEDMSSFMNTMATYIVSGGNIKLAVMGQANESSK